MTLRQRYKVMNVYRYHMIRLRGSKDYPDPERVEDDAIFDILTNKWLDALREERNNVE